MGDCGFVFGDAGADEEAHSSAIGSTYDVSDAAAIVWSDSVSHTNPDASARGNQKTHDPAHT